MKNECSAYLSSRGKVHGDVPSEDTAGLVSENEDAGLAVRVDASACCQAAGDENEVLVWDDIDVRSGAGEVNACLEGTVGVAGDGRSAGPVSRRRCVLDRTAYLGMNGLAVVNSMVG